MRERVYKTSRRRLYWDSAMTNKVWEIMSHPNGFTVDGIMEELKITHSKSTIIRKLESLAKERGYKALGLHSTTGGRSHIKPIADAKLQGVGLTKEKAKKLGKRKFMCLCVINDGSKIWLSIREKDKELAEERIVEEYPTVQEVLTVLEQDEYNEYKTKKNIYGRNYQ